MLNQTLLGAAAALLAISTVPAAAQPDKPNVVLIMADDHRHDMWGSFGGENLTPAIDRLAEQGVKFGRAYCVSAACTPSRFNLLTGKYSGRSNHPWATGRKNEPYCVQWVTFLTEGDSNLATRLNEAGYFTGMAGKWHVTQHVDKATLPEIDPKANLDDPATSEKLAEHQRLVAEDIAGVTGFDYVANVLANNADHLPVKALETHHPEWITAGALEFLDTTTTKDQPFFLYLAATSVHSPQHQKALDKNPVYTPEGKVSEEAFSASPSRESVRQRLQAAGLPVNHQTVGLLMLDDSVSVVMNRLEEMGVADNTLVVLVADHGVEPAKLANYEEGVRTPMIVKWPSRLEAGTTTNALTSMVDISASILEVAGATPTGDDPIDGLSFLKRDGKGLAPKRKYVYFENGFTRGISDGEYKLITLRFPDRIVAEMKDGTRAMAADHADMPRQEQPVISMKSYPHYWDANQLYHLPTDPYEQNNLVGDPEQAATLERMMGELRNVLVEFDHPYPLDDTDFLSSEQFRTLVEARMAHEETTVAGKDSRIAEFRAMVEQYEGK